MSEVQSTRRMRAAIVGPGFIARQHVDALRRLGDVDIVGAAGSGSASTDQKIRALGVERLFANYQELVASPDVDVVHVTAPNHMHLPVVLAAHAAGKHVVCEKPMALDRPQALIMRDSARMAQTRHGTASIVVFNYRGGALVQQTRGMVEQGEAGVVSFVHGAYLQDWMFSPDVYSWRSDPEKGGASSALVDIGSHWCDLAQYIGDSNISAVCADLATAVPQRLRPDTAQESFATTRMKGTLVEVSAEDTGSVMLRFANGARGSFQVGQVHAGHKNDLWIEINGRTLSLRWRQEQQNELWIGRHDQPSQVLVKEPAALQPYVRRFSPLPAGHQEGWADSLLNVLREGYGWMRAGVHTPKPAAVASFEDGSQIHAVLDAILRSHSVGGTWQSVAD